MLLVQDKGVQWPAHCWCPLLTVLSTYLEQFATPVSHFIQHGMEPASDTEPSGVRCSCCCACLMYMPRSMTWQTLLSLCPHCPCLILSLSSNQLLPPPLLLC